MSLLRRINQREEDLEEEESTSAEPAPGELTGERWTHKFDSPVYATAISRDGRFVVAGSRDGDLLFFDITGRLFWQARVEGAVVRIALAEAAEAFAVGTLGGNRAYLWHFSGQLLHTYDAEASTPGIAVTPDASRVAVGSQDRHLALYGSGGDLIARREVGGPIRQVALSGDGELILVASEDNRVYAFDRAASPRWTFETSGSVWAGVRIAPEAGRVLAGSNDRHVYCLDFDGTELWRFDTGGLVNQVALTPDASLCAVVGKSGVAYLLNERGNVLWEHPTGENSYGLALADDGRYTALGTHEGALLLADRQPAPRILWDHKLGAHVWSLAMTPDGGYLAAALADHTLHVFENTAARQNQPELLMPDSKMLVQLVTQQVHQDFATSPNLGLVRWFSEFERSLRHTQYDVCKALLAEANDSNSLGLSDGEQHYTRSLEGAYWLVRGAAFHRQQQWAEARACYEKSRTIQDSINNLDGVGQVVAVLTALPTDAAPAEEEAEAGPDSGELSDADLRLLDEIVARPRVLGSSEKLLERRLAEASADEQFQIVLLARQRGLLAPLLGALTAEERAIRAAAGAALTYLRPGPGAETLGSMLKTAEPFVRWQALRILRQRVEDSAEAFAALKEQLWSAVVVGAGDRSPDPLVRREEAQLVGSAGTVEDTDWLLARVDDPDVDVQIAVFTALGQVADRRALPVLRAVTSRYGFLGENSKKSADEAVAEIEKRYPTPTLERIVLSQIDPLANEPVQQSSLFMTDTGTVYCAVLVAHPPSGLQLSARWFHNDDLLKEDSQYSLAGSTFRLADIRETPVGTDPTRRPFGARFGRPPVPAPDDFYDDDDDEDNGPPRPVFGRSPFGGSSGDRPGSPFSRPPGSPSPVGSRPAPPPTRFGSRPPAPPDLLENTGPDESGGEQASAVTSALPGGFFRRRPLPADPDPAPPRPVVSGRPFPPPGSNPFSRPAPGLPPQRPSPFGARRAPGSPPQRPSPFGARPAPDGSVPRPSPFSRPPSPFGTRPSPFGGSSGRPASPFARSTPDQQFVFGLERPERGWQAATYRLEIALDSDITREIEFQFVDRVPIARLEPGILTARPGPGRTDPLFSASQVFLTTTSPVACQVVFREAPVDLEVTASLYSAATGVLFDQHTARTTKQGFQSVQFGWDNPGWRPGLYRIVASTPHSDEASTEIELIARLEIRSIALCHRVDEDQGPVGMGWPFHPGDTCFCVVEFEAAPPGIAVQAELYAKEAAEPLVQTAPQVVTAGGEQRAVFALRDSDNLPLRPGHYAVVIRGSDVNRRERSFEVLALPRWQVIEHAAARAGRRVWDFIRKHHIQMMLRDLGAVILLALAFVLANEALKQVVEREQRSRDVVLSAGYSAGQPGVWWALGWLALGAGYGILRTRKVKELSRPIEEKTYPVVNALLIFFSSALAWYLLTCTAFGIGSVRPGALWGLFDQLRWLAPVVAWIAPAAGYWLAVKYQDGKQPDVFYTAPALAGAAVLGIILVGAAGALIVGLPLGLLVGIVGSALDLAGLGNALGRGALGVGASLGFVLGPAAAAAIYFRDELTKAWDDWQDAKKETPRLTLLNQLIDEKVISITRDQYRQVAEWSGWVAALMGVVSVLLLALFRPMIRPVLAWFYDGRGHAAFDHAVSAAPLMPVLALALFLVWPALVYAGYRMLGLADLKRSEIEVTRRLAQGLAGAAVLALPVVAFTSHAAFGPAALPETVVFWTNRLTALVLMLALGGWYLWQYVSGSKAVREALDLGDFSVEDVGALIVAVLAVVLTPVWMWSLVTLLVLILAAGGYYLLDRVR